MGRKKVPHLGGLGSVILFAFCVAGSAWHWVIRTGRSRPMVRPLRVEFPGACYHVINRGNFRFPMFGTGIGS